MCLKMSSKLKESKRKKVECQRLNSIYSIRKLFMNKLMGMQYARIVSTGKQNE